MSSLADLLSHLPTFPSSIAPFAIHLLQHALTVKQRSRCGYLLIMATENIAHWLASRKYSSFDFSMQVRAMRCTPEPALCGLRSTADDRVVFFPATTFRRAIPPPLISNSSPVACRSHSAVLRQSAAHPLKSFSPSMPPLRRDPGQHQAVMRVLKLQLRAPRHV